MTLEGAINFNETNDYTIYTMNSVTAGQYCVVLPKNNNGNYNMLVDLHMKSLFDGVSTGAKTKDDLISEISGEYNKVKTKYSDSMLVIPMVDDDNYINIINNDDKQKMFDEVKKIGAITSELYKKLIESGIDKQKIDQKIIIIEKNDYDKKFVDWLIGQMPNFVSGVGYSEFEVVNSNPFMGSNSDGSEVNNIFGSPVVDSSNVSPVVEENVNVVPPVNDLFGNTNETPVENINSQVQEPAISQPQPEVANIFGEQSNSNVVEQPVQQSVEQPVQPEVQNQVVEEPKPVQSVELDKTVTFSPVGENSAVVSNNVSSQEVTPNTTPVVDGNNQPSNEVASEVKVTKKSNGFVNLAILLVILVGVTLVSIELGKFLYNTYGV